jgi:tetratricopeptide (TPR) repeat protein
MLYTKNNDLAKALECFRKAASCAPLNPFIHTNLGSILLEQQRYAEAAREYELVLTIDPKLTDVHKNLALLYYDQLGQRLKAFFHMQKYIESNPSDQLSAMFGKLMDSFEKQDGAF